jgi:hypothetical protein
MRIAIVIAALASLVGCGAGSAAQNASSASTDLKITVWPNGREGGGARSFTLRCGPAAGTLPKAATACSKLGTLPRPFAPVSRDAVCTEQYGGPQQALVTGRLRGNPVWAAFSMTNGCQIGRARKIAFLLPGFGTSSNA